MKFRPLHDRVVVKRIEAEEKSVGGIIIPDTAKWLAHFIPLTITHSAKCPSAYRLDGDKLVALGTSLKLPGHPASMRGSTP
jgi:hypothetical protein